jgi:hypothetical protein
VTYSLKQWSDVLETLDREGQSLWKITEMVMRISIPSPTLQMTGELALSFSENAKAVVKSLTAQFHPTRRTRQLLDV